MDTTGFVETVMAECYRTEISEIAACMSPKKDRGRFTICFDMSDSDHRFAVKYLEQQRDRGKAQYIAQAILFYEKNANKRISTLDRALIEQIIREYLERQTDGKSELISPIPQNENCNAVPLHLISDALAEFNK